MLSYVFYDSELTKNSITSIKKKTDEYFKVPLNDMV